MRHRFQKWVLRSDHSIIFRWRLKRCSKHSLDKISNRKVFDSLAFYTKQQSMIKKKLNRVFTNVTQVNLRFSFDEIQHRVKSVQHKNAAERANG